MPDTMANGVGRAYIHCSQTKVGVKRLFAELCQTDIFYKDGNWNPKLVSPSSLKKGNRN